MADIEQVVPGKPVWRKRPEDEHPHKRPPADTPPSEEETPASDDTDAQAPLPRDDDDHQLDLYV